MSKGINSVEFETLAVRVERAVLFAGIAAPPMNLLGLKLVRDLVSLIQLAETDDAIRVLVFQSGDPDFFISRVEVTRIKEYREEAAKLSGASAIVTTSELLVSLAGWQPNSAT